MNKQKDKILLTNATQTIHHQLYKVLTQNKQTNNTLTPASSRPTKRIIGYIGDDFYGSDDPTNSVRAVKDNYSLSVHQSKGHFLYKVKWSKYS